MRISEAINPFLLYLLNYITFLPWNQLLTRKNFSLPKSFSKKSVSVILLIGSLVKSIPISIFVFWVELEKIMQHITSLLVKVVNPNKGKYLSWLRIT